MCGIKCIVRDWSDPIGCHIFFLLKIYCKRLLLCNAFCELFIYLPSRRFIQWFITVWSFICLNTAIHWFCTASRFINFFGQPVFANMCALFQNLPEILFCVNRRPLKRFIQWFMISCALIHIKITTHWLCVAICFINLFGQPVFGNVCALFLNPPGIIDVVNRRPLNRYIQWFNIPSAFIYLKIMISWFCVASCFINLFG